MLGDGRKGVETLNPVTNPRPCRGFTVQGLLGSGLDFCEALLVLRGILKKPSLFGTRVER